MRQLTFLFIVSEVILYVSAVTHWVVTDNDKIQPVLNPIFSLKNPDDFLTLLEQEDRKIEAEKLFKSIVARKASIDKQWAYIDLLVNVENLYYTSDPNCQVVNKDTANINFYASIATDGSFRQGITPKDFLLNAELDDNEFDEPDCEETFPLDFSMYTFEHLEVMKTRKNLSQRQEKDLIKYLSPGMSIEKFSSHIFHGLRQNKTSWLHLNLGAIYWRYKGNAYKALECARRAIVTAPRHYRDIPLLTMGGILHAARHSAEAAIILHAAINYAPDQSRQHLALGNIYAVLGDYKRSIACYDNCLKLSPNMQQAQVAKHTILCHLKVEESVNLLQSQLQIILLDLQIYDKEQNEWLKIIESILQVKDWKSQYFGLNDEMQHVFNEGPMQTCTRDGDNSQMLPCELKQRSLMLPPNLHIDINLNLQILKNVEKEARKINEQISKSTFFRDLNYDTEIEFVNKEPSQSVEVFLESDVEYSEEEFLLNQNWDSDDWPAKSSCPYESTETNTKDYVPIFLSYGNPSELLDSLTRNMEDGSSLNLPTCETAHNSHDYFTATLLKLLKTSSVTEKADLDLRDTLIHLVKLNDINVIGKKISFAMKTESINLWIIYSISSLYWRVVGNFYEALKCAQSSLDSAPSELKNIPLVNIASILQKFNKNEQALATIQQAFNIEANEPVTNFIYGSLLHRLGNNNDALRYLKQAMKNNIHSANDKAMSMLIIIVCRIKFSIS